jgi:hypothetical protein
VPKDTACVARADFPPGNLYMQMREGLDVLDEDARFAALVRQWGQPAEVPWRLARLAGMLCNVWKGDPPVRRSSGCSTVLPG